MFVTFLQYKLEEQGKKLVKVDKFLQVVKFIMFVVTRILIRKILVSESGTVLNVAHDRDVSNQHPKRGYAVNKGIANK